MFATTHTRRSIVCAAAAVATSAFMLAAPIAPVHAAEPLTRSVTVNVADLDLSRPAGQATLQARIDAAAKRVCPSDGGKVVSESIAQRRCLDQARAGAAAQLASVIRA